MKINSINSGSNFKNNFRRIAKNSVAAAVVGASFQAIRNSYYMKKNKELAAVIKQDSLKSIGRCAFYSALGTAIINTVFLITDYVESRK